MSEPSEQSPWKRLLSPWKITAALLAVVLLVTVYMSWQDREPLAALQSHPALVAPPFDLQFSSKFPYDPHSFVGRGARAGLWQWTPDGLLLTEQGQKYFEQSGEMFVSKSVAGTRRIKRIHAIRKINGQWRVEFLYEWTAVSAPAAALLVPPPRTGEDYPGEAVLSRDEQGWHVRSLRTLDFEKPMEHLKDIAAGVRR